LPDVSAQQPSDDGSGDASRGRLIVFEGVEGCGKSTQIQRLASRVQESGRRVQLTREPGGTRLGEAIRQLLLEPEFGAIDGLTELFLLSASRRIHVEQILRPALARGEIVLCDRFVDSSVAYQGGGRELGFARVEQLSALATGGLAADLTILLDLPAADGLRRVVGRGGREDRLESESRAFHARVRDSYLEIARRRGATYRTLDAALSVDQIAAEVWAAVAPLL
jgi:dTMP kinase